MTDRRHDRCNKPPNWSVSWELEETDRVSYKTERIKALEINDKAIKSWLKDQDHLTRRPCASNGVVSIYNVVVRSGPRIVRS